jgi:aquaporin Z
MQQPRPAGAMAVFRGHWREYLIEAAALGTFMVSACAFCVLLEHPASPVRQAIPNGLLRRILMGFAMGATAIGLIYSPWGKRSGAHMNPAVTLTFFRLGKVSGWDSFFYIMAQFVGGVAGVLLCVAILGKAVAHESVRYVVTLPGSPGAAVAFAAELAISFILMTVVLNASNSIRLASRTGLFAGLLVATYISIEAPYSGMSMNPARTFGSAAVAGVWNAWWVYFTAPVLGMLLAAEIYTRTHGPGSSLCAKLDHSPGQPCIFNCGYDSFRSGDIIIREGEHADVAYIIEAGEVEVRKADRKTGHVVLARLGPQQFIGEMALLLNRPRFATVVALTDVRLRRFDRRNFAEVIARDPESVRVMLTQLAERLGELDAQVAAKSVNA